MRTVDATLTAALAAGTGKPILTGYIGYMDGSVLHSEAVESYKLTGTTLEFVMPYVSDMISDQSAIWLKRGLNIAGTEYTVTTGRFALDSQTYLPNRRQLAKGTLFPRQYYDGSGHASYQSVIDAFCTAFGKTAVYADDTQAWLDYMFLAAGANITLSDAMTFLNVLEQKRLIKMCDKGSEQVLVYCADAMHAKDLDVTIKDLWAITSGKRLNRQYIWKDEAGVAHQDGTTTDPIHNLGYLERTDSAPARHSSSLLTKIIMRPDLRMLDGDVIRAIFYGGSTFTFWAQVTEEWNPHLSKEPKWRLVLESNPIFHNTEGGALPGQTAEIGALAGLNVSNFDNILSANDTNMQTAFETLDDHTHAGGGGDGWSAMPYAGSYSSADSPTFVLSVAGDVTGVISAGMRIKLTQTTVKYFIVTAVGAYSGGVTLLTLYGGTDYTLADAAVSALYYSTAKAPLGFPLSPAKWTTKVEYASDAVTNNPTRFTWYNATSLSIPIGLWRIRCTASAYAINATNGAEIRMTLSTANNSESDNNYTTINGLSATAQSMRMFSKENILDLAAKSTRHLNYYTANLSTTVLGLLGSVTPSTILAECAYV